MSERLERAYQVRDIEYGPPVSLDGRGRETYLMACKLCGAFIPSTIFAGGTHVETHVAWHNELAGLT